MYYIRLSEKFLSFYEEVIDAQHFLFYIIFSNYVRSILYCWDKHRDISQTWFHVPRWKNLPPTADFSMLNRILRLKKSDTTGETNKTGTTYSAVENQIWQCSQRDNNCRQWSANGGQRQFCSRYTGTRSLFDCFFELSQAALQLYVTLRFSRQSLLCISVDCDSNLYRILTLELPVVDTKLFLPKPVKMTGL